MAVERIVVPTELSDALRILHEEGEAAVILAGGSNLAFKIPGGVRTLVDILRCGLEGVTTEGRELVIGATTPAAALAATPALDEFGAVLVREAAAAISAQAVRNQVTLGGNLVGTLSWGDLPVALAALDASVRTQRHGGKRRTLEMAELFAKNPRKVLDRGELVTHVVLRRPAPHTGGAFIKMARTVAELALASCAVVLRVEDGLCRDVRIALGAVQPRPQRARKAERALDGAPADAGLFAHAAEIATADLAVTADLRASKEHRRRVLGVAVRRALDLAYRRAVGEATYAPVRRPMPPRWTRRPVADDVGRRLRVTVDGSAREIPIRPDQRLLDALRQAGVTTVKRGCDEGYCGTCAVLVDGRLMNACMLLAAQVDGCTLTTVAGIGTLFAPHPLQTAMVAAGAVQCGFCTPGFVVAAKSLLDQVPDPTREELAAALDGNLCRCTGYVKQLEAIETAARALRQSSRR